MKRTIAVLFGGCSSEYGVSLASACSILEHMDRNRYTPVMIGISAKGEWFRYSGDLRKIADDTWYDPVNCLPAALSPSRPVHELLVLHPGRVERIPVDAVFPVLHGRNGEDGTVQGLVELAGIPLVGCGTLASALCMDKDRAHRLVHEAGMAVPASFTVERTMDLALDLKLADRLGYPLFVKPVRAGSSYGISRVCERSGFLTAVQLALRYDDRVIVEESIDGHEVGCAIMGNDCLTTGEVDEIELAGGFFDFTEKYTLKTSAIHVPAPVPPEKAVEIKQTAEKIYAALGCSGFARVDMFLTPSGRIVFNEVNTIPGFTAHSRFPNMMKAAGISLEQGISHVIDLAIEQ